MDSVQPLRISKSGNTPATSPNKMATSRPLAEIGNTSQRRNSPSYNQATRKAIVSRESSPYTENSLEFPSKASPSPFKDRMSPFRFDENTPDRSPSPSLSPTRRSSIERLKQSARVKNSNIFALETKDAYDPTSLPIVERPTANRPLSMQLANNSFTRYDSLKKENNPLRSPQRSNGHKRSGSEFNVPFLSPTMEAAEVPLPYSPEKQFSPSPTKSSLSRISKYGLAQEFNEGAPSDDERASTPRALHRHNKSVTFHADPPEINEYEQQTPEPSVSVGSREGSWDSEDYEQEDYSFERGSSVEQDREDSFDEDLENADKTPVVLPEDWSRMSPEAARTDLINRDDDVFDESPSPTRPPIGRSTSVTSDGESRPLPPLPGFMKAKRPSCSKDEIMKMMQPSTTEHEQRPGSNSSADTERGIPEELVITNLDTGEKSDIITPAVTVEELGDLPDLAAAPPRISRESILRKIRSSKYDFEDESDDDASVYDGGETKARPTYAELAEMDPDQPIQSRENSRETSSTYLTRVETVRIEKTHEVLIKAEPTDDDEIDLDAIPAIDTAQLQPPRSPSRMEDYDRQSSVIRRRMSTESAPDDASQYSEEPEAESTMLNYAQPEPEVDGKETLQDAMQLLTMKDYGAPEPEPAPRAVVAAPSFVGLPAYLTVDDYDFGMGQYITPSPPASSDSTKKLDLNAVPSLQPSAIIAEPQQYQNPYTKPPVISPPGTPDSIVQHRTSDVSTLHDHEQYDYLYDAPELQPQPQPETIPEVLVPERKSTIKTSGKLKSRPSASRADLEAIGQRRPVSGEEEPAVPSIPSTYLQERGILIDDATASAAATEKAGPIIGVGEKRDVGQERRRQSGKLRLDVGFAEIESGGVEGASMLGLDEEFERVIEGQKQKGYLLRQNEKVIVASARNFSNDTDKSMDSNNLPPMSPTMDARPGRGTRSAGNSPRKPSAEQFLKTEPWNGKARRKSLRNASAQGASYMKAPAPPLPGQESALGVVDEDYAAGTSNLDDDVAEGVERGRLFVKVVGVKELDLPMPRNDRLYFQLTLDNGLHCVTTANLELGKKAAIGQEFELVVQEDLEFQLTLTTKLPPPPKAPPMSAPPSPTKSLKSQKGGFASRFLSSPKKKAERERQEREALEAEERRAREEAQRKRATIQPTAWDMLHDLVNAADGSFARSYINLKTHEHGCFGRQMTVDVPCYNEWALEKDTHVVNSVRSKRGTHAGPVRKPPYVVGKLELQLLYVPKPRGAGDEDMPKSMSSALREINKAVEIKEVVHEGCLSQQGGDCTHWRRRFFRLQGSRLTAYHEHTHQKRAVINLAKASRLVDDKSTLVSNPANANGVTGVSAKGRRKSAFAEEDEGYQYVEEGFRIRFANGETIDFYSDSAGEKDSWMEALRQVVGKPVTEGSKKGKWTDLVLARERAAAAAGGVASTASSSVDTSSSPSKFSVTTGTTETQDFATAAAAAAGALPRPAVQRKPSDRKSVPFATASRSVPGSPVKGPPTQRPPPPPMARAETSRAGTPPMAPRTKGRARDAVKSMIF
ncbi:Bud site selection protein bud4 [Recurvomyces mirabilis]|uniref:Bud site selection protein bud4 n=1 Tax=Recurvomyces mirabilis TaxID=574656 RepID=A0AAE0TU12_9PEZI|nr:Bud site selection protein bud4 [Recurvomyces mirabilis]KAK5150674.1 Bud site selection protein bud4 [Recurvomyces mirabilis]